MIKIGKNPKQQEIIHLEVLSDTMFERTPDTLTIYNAMHKLYQCLKALLANQEAVMYLRNK